MIDRVRQGDQRSPGMSHDNGLLDTKLSKSIPDERRLSGSGPNLSPRPLAVSEAWPVNRNHTMVPSQEVKQPTDLEVFHEALIAMKQHNRRSSPLFQVMEPHPVNFHERTFGWIAPFGLSCEGALGQRNNATPDCRRYGDSCGFRKSAASM